MLSLVVFNSERQNTALKKCQVSRAKSSWPEGRGQADMNIEVSFFPPVPQFSFSILICVQVNT